MPISSAQLQEEQRKEAEFNKLFNSVAQKSPFGQWFGLMKMASDLLTQNLPKQVCIQSDGRPLVVYKKDINKLLGVWATPTHEVISKNLSEKKYDKALGALLGIGQINEMIKQNKAQKRGECFDLSPEDVIRLYEERQARFLLKQKNVIQKRKLKEIPSSKPISVKNNIFGGAALGTAIGIVAFPAVAIIGGLVGATILGVRAAMKNANKK